MFAVWAASSRPTSSVTVANTSAGSLALATMVATRLSAACSTSRSCTSEEPAEASIEDQPSHTGMSKSAFRHSRAASGALATRGIDGHLDLRGVAEAPSLVDVDDVAPERRERDRYQLEVREPEWDPDDRQAHQHAGDQVAEREP